MKLLIILLIFVFLSCSSDPIHTIDGPEYDKILVTQDYDSIYIKNDEIMVEQQNIDKIELKYLKDGNYFLADSLIPDYINMGQAFSVEFEFHLKINKSYPEYQFLITYYLNDGEFVDIESHLQMKYYPYSFFTKELYLKLDDIFENPKHPQDIDFDDNHLYLHPTAAWGVFQISMHTNTAKELVYYPAGDFLAVDSNYIFYETWAIFRLNLKTDSTDLRINWDYEKYNNITGIDAYKGHLYVILSNDDQIDLVKYDYSGNYIETIPYNKNTWFMTIYFDIVHSREIIDNKYYISRFDLKSKTFLESVPYPAIDPEGFKIFNHKFYYTEWTTREIYSINMYEIFNWN